MVTSKCQLFDVINCYKYKGVDPLMNGVEELRILIESQEKEISLIQENEFNAKPNSEKWSKKEILGHLCDSGSNNHRRFIMIKNSTTPIKIESYDQNYWVSSNNYQEEFSMFDVIHLWKLLNKQIISVLSTCDSLDFEKKFQIDEKKTETLGWLVDDYINHMSYHLAQINKK
jgi:hypothetical protein